MLERSGNAFSRMSTMRMEMPQQIELSCPRRRIGAKIGSCGLRFFTSPRLRGEIGFRAQRKRSEGIRVRGTLDVLSSWRVPSPGPQLALLADLSPPAGRGKKAPCPPNLAPMRLRGGKLCAPYELAAGFDAARPEQEWGEPRRPPRGLAESDCIGPLVDGDHALDLIALESDRRRIADAGQHRDIEQLAHNPLDAQPLDGVAGRHVDDQEPATRHGAARGQR